MPTTELTRTEPAAIATAMADLAEGRWAGFRARDVDVDAFVRIAAKERDRYLVEVMLGERGAREEWRSGGWIRKSLERGAWVLVDPEPADLARRDDRPTAPAAPAPAALGHAVDPAATLIRRPLRGGVIEVAVPPDMTGPEALAAAGELDRIAAYLRTFA